MTNEFLLSDKQVAMDELLAACQMAAERCAEGADIVQEEAGLASVLRRAAGRQAEAADALDEIIRRGDHLPQGENDEKELLASLAAQLRAMMSPERKTRVIDACLACETDLRDSIRKLSAFDLEAPLETRLNELDQHVRETIDALRDARPDSH